MAGASFCDKAHPGQAGPTYGAFHVRSLEIKLFESATRPHMARKTAILLGLGGFNTNFRITADQIVDLSKKYLAASDVMPSGLFLKSFKTKQPDN
jgi:hypothetical protein